MNRKELIRLNNVWGVNGHVPLPVGAPPGVRLAVALEPVNDEAGAQPQGQPLNSTQLAPVFTRVFARV